jgi:hypothetical protein
LSAAPKRSFGTSGAFADEDDDEEDDEPSDADGDGPSLSGASTLPLFGSERGPPPPDDARRVRGAGADAMRG